MAKAASNRSPKAAPAPLAPAAAAPPAPIQLPQPAPVQAFQDARRAPNTESRGRAIDIVPGFIVICEFSALGGVSYERKDYQESREGVKLQAEFSTEKRVDNVDLVALSRRIIARANYLMESNCAHTPIGWFATDEMWRKLNADMQEMREAADVFNQTAKMAGSRRRVVIEIYPIQLNPQGGTQAQESIELIARRLAKTIRDRLTDVRDALRAGDIKLFDAAMEKCANLDKLTTGVLRDSVSIAIDGAKVAKTALREALRENPGIASSVVGASLDVESIDAAIGMFTDPESA